MRAQRNPAHSPAGSDLTCVSSSLPPLPVSVCVCVRARKREMRVYAVGVCATHSLSLSPSLSSTRAWVVPRPRAHVGVSLRTQSGCEDAAARGSGMSPRGLEKPRCHPLPQFRSVPLKGSSTGRVNCAQQNKLLKHCVFGCVYGTEFISKRLQMSIKNK